MDWTGDCNRGPNSGGEEKVREEIWQEISKIKAI